MLLVFRFVIDVEKVGVDWFGKWMFVYVVLIEIGLFV